MCGVSRRRWCSRIPEKYRSCNEPTMSSVQCLREFVNERLTAAAEEIFGVFEKTIVEYEQEIDRQRRLLDIVWKPEIKLHRVELPQQHVCKEEEVLPDQQLWNQERNSSLDQEDPEPSQFKEEQEQLCSSQEGEQLVVKQETDTFMWTPTNEDSDQQLLSHSSPAAESQDQRGSQPVESGSARNAETKSKKRRHQNTSHSNNDVDKSLMSELPQQHVCKEEEVLPDQQLWNQERNSSLDQEDPEPPQFKEEQDQLCSSQEGEQLVVKQQTDTFMWTPTNEDSDQSEAEPHSDQQLLSHSSPAAESQDQRGSQPVESGSARNAETKSKKRRHQNTSHSNNDVDKSLMSELPQQHVCKEEEVLPDQQLWNQERNSSLDQEDPEPPQFKEEQDQLCSSQEGEQLVMKQETDTFMWTPTNEDSDQSEAEPHSDQQLLSHSSPAAESQDQRGSQPVESGSARKAETKSKKRRHQNTSHSNNDVDKSLMSGDAHTGKRTFLCDTCGKTFKYKSTLDTHMRVHTGEKPHVCSTCGKRFSTVTVLKNHVRIHTGEKPYPCETCGKTFREKSSLKTHMRTHTGEKPYPCNTCGEKFSYTSSLRLHMITHTGEKPYFCEICRKGFKFSSIFKIHLKTHTGERPYTCSTCRKSFCHVSQLKRHMRVHTAAKSYCCEVCRKVFRSSSVLKIHLRSHTGEKPYPCTTCKKSFSDMSTLRKHMKIHTELPQQHVCKEEEVLPDQQLWNQERNSSLDQEDPEPPQFKEEQDQLCSSQEGEQLVMKQETDTFMWTPTNEDSDQSEAEPHSDQQLLSHSSPAAESQDQRGSQPVESGSARNAETKSKKRRHQNTSHSNNDVDKSLMSGDAHTGKRTFLCDTCGKTFKYKSTLDTHMRVHTGEKPHVCSTCGKRFSTVTVLKNHVRIHTGEKPYPCETCGKTFREKSSLKTHMRTHTGEKPYPCNTCGEKFSYTSSLRLHMITHTGEKPYFCEICRKGFKFSSIFKIHLKTHTGERPYTCSTCRKSFCHVSQLKRHMRVHTAAKSYCCEVCRKVFRSSSVLKIHLRSHTGEKPYPCTTCKKSFSDMSTLRKHMKIHTELPQQHVCKEEEVLPDQQLWNQERNSSVDQVDPEPPQIKEEQEQLCSSQEGEQLVVKQETDTFMWTPTNEDSDQSEAEPHSDQQLLSHSSPAAESQDQTGSQPVESGSARNAETKSKKRRHQNTSHSNNDVDKSLMSELPQQHVCKEEEVLPDQQLWNQERNSSVDQEDPEPPQIKEEQEQLCCSQEGEQLVVKQETDTFMWTPTNEDSNHSEAEPHSDQQLLSHSSPAAESQDQTGSQPVESGSARNAETKPKKRRHQNTSHSNNDVDKSLMSGDAHTGKRTFLCGTCGKTFRCKSKLNKHMRVHTGEKPHTCSVCRKGFGKKSHLIRHVRSHTGEKPYSCEICKKSFIRNSMLKIHLRTHTGEKPYPCTTCGKSFREMSQLKIHVRIHTGEKPYSCSLCGTRFSERSTLIRHMRIHTGEKPYTCTTCGKRFSYKSVLKYHMMIHTGEKPHTCNFCGKGFGKKSSLINHVRTHTGEKPYSCEICKKRFICNSILKIHLGAHKCQKP
ncbi:zinc finger protein 91-like isoform X3 [Mastacembelus armatus]|uniref:zinc finger protein 91-like isoform X3 n=1 Tax=Mastacembelus armatus TaxID=205130 RepID=UPI000E45B5BB|nr:zinc finger protein 91-like isoform X3 [Mastacembelus armatus]